MPRMIKLDFTKRKKLEDFLDSKRMLGKSFYHQYNGQVYTVMDFSEINGKKVLLVDPVSEREFSMKNGSLFLNPENRLMDVFLYKSEVELYRDGKCDFSVR